MGVFAVDSGSLLVKLLLAPLLLASASAAATQPLTVRTGESWVFTVRHGQPVDARQVAASAKPRRGELLISVRRFLGTSMMVTNNTPAAYRFRAELLVGGKAATARACSLPATPSPIFEQWQQQADAVRVSNFEATGPAGRC
jgi:phosphate-selective porin